MIRRLSELKPGFPERATKLISERLPEATKPGAGLAAAAATTPHWRHHDSYAMLENGENIITASLMKH